MVLGFQTPEKGTSGKVQSEHDPESCAKRGEEKGEPGQEARRVKGRRRDQVTYGRATQPLGWRSLG